MQNLTTYLGLSKTPECGVYTGENTVGIATIANSGSLKKHYF
jgi:hypothetical protein